jgi:hypothetical protein
MKKLHARKKMFAQTNKVCASRKMFAQTRKGSRFMMRLLKNVCANQKKICASFRMFTHHRQASSYCLAWLLASGFSSVLAVRCSTLKVLHLSRSDAK